VHFEHHDIVDLIGLFETEPPVVFNSQGAVDIISRVHLKVHVDFASDRQTVADCLRIEHDHHILDLNFQIGFILNRLGPGQL